MNVRFHSSGRRRITLAALSVGGLLIALAGCGQSAGSNAATPAARPAAFQTRGEGPSTAPLVLVGIDGFEWDVVLPLLRSGQMPALAGLMQRGRYGLLETVTPTLSPVIWTTVATGKTLEHHGILNFTKREKDGRERLFSNRDRQTKAVWNILSDFGVRTAVVGWWVTYPAEPIHGVMVSQTNTAAEDNLWKGELVRGLPGQVFPAERQDGVMQVLDESDAGLPELQKRIFRPFPHALNPQQQKNWDKTLWAFRADATYHRIALQLLRERPAFDVLMLYLGGTDVTGHRFWWYMQPEAYDQKPGPEQIDNFGEIIRDYYRYTDRMLAELIAAAPAETNWLIVADHGMVAMHPPRPFFSAGHTNGPPGVFVAAGPAIAAQSPGLAADSLTRESLPTIGGVLDLSPTILAAFRIPAGQDMSGRVLGGLFGPAFSIERQPPAIASHDPPDYLASRAKLETFEEDPSERLEQLRGLGYLGGMAEEADADDQPTPASAPAERMP